MNTETGVELFTIAKAKRIIRDNGPQLMDRLRRNLMADVLRLFPGSTEFSRRGAVLRALDAAVERGVFVVSWDHVCGEDGPRVHMVALSETAFPTGVAG